MRRSKRARRRLIALIAVVALAGLSFVTYRVGRGMQRDRLLSEARADGLAAYADGEYENALDRLAYYISGQKEDIEVLIAFGDARSRIPQANNHHLQEASGYNREALRLLARAPEYPDRAEVRLEVLHRQLDLYGALAVGVELLDTANQILDANPDDIEALRAKALALSADRRFAEAQPVAQKLSSIDPDDLKWRQMEISILIGMNEPVERLLAQCDEWIGEGDPDGRYHMLKAELQAQTGKVREARADALLASEAGLPGEELLGRLVSLMDRLDLRTEATELIVQTRASHPDALWVREEIIRRFWQADEIGAALEALAETRRDVDDIGPRLRRLEPILLAASGDNDEALRALGVTASSGDEHDRLWSEAVGAWLDFEGQTWAPAIEKISLALSVEPNDAVLNYVMGRVLLAAGEFAGAVTSLERAATREPNWVRAAYSWTEALIASGRAGDAYLAARELLRRAPRTHLDAHLAFCRAYIELVSSGGDGRLIDRHSGEFVDVVDVLEPLVQQFPTHVELATLLVDAYMLSGRRVPAEDMFRHVVASDAVSADVLIALAGSSRRYALGYDEQLIERARALGATPAAAAIAEARMLARSERIDDALALLDQAAADADSEIAVRKAKIDLMRRHDAPGILGELKTLVSRDRSTLTTISFALGVPAAWDDEVFAQSLVDRLRAMLGPRAQQTRLATARHAIEFHADNEAKLAEAMVTIGDVLEESPESIAALTTMAAALQVGASPDYGRAASYLEQVVKLYPGRAATTVHLIDLMQKTGDYAGAQRYLDHLARLSERRPDLRRTQIALLRRQGDFESAREHATDLAAGSDDASDQLLLAAMHQRVGRLTDAERVYRRLLEDHPGDELISVQAADLFARTGRFDDGRTLIAALSPEGGGAVREAMLASYCERHGRVDEAGGHWKKAVTIDPASVELNHRLAQHHLRQRDWAAASDAAMNALRLDGEHAGARLTLALAGFGADERGRQKAIDELRAMGAGNEALLDTLALLQSVREVNGVSQPSQPDLERAVTLTRTHPTFLPAWYLAVTLHLDAGRVDAAIDHARRAVSRFPMSAEPARWSTQVLIQAGRWADAHSEAEEWRRRALHAPLDADLAIAAILLQLERPDDAVRQLDPHRAQLAASDVFEHTAILVEALLRSGRRTDAMSLLGDRVERDELWRQRLISIGQRLGMSDGYDLLMSLEPFVRTPSEQLGLASGWTNLGRRHERDECFDRAVTLIGLAERDQDLALDSALMRASIAEARGNLAEAAQLYRGVVQAAPDHVWALNNLAAVLVRHGVDLPEALRHVEHALEILPNQADLLDTRALALLALDRPVEAEAAALEALAKRPNDVGLGLTLVESLLAAGRVDDARTRLHRLERRLEQTETTESLRARFEGVRQQLRASAAAGT